MTYLTSIFFIIFTSAHNVLFIQTPSLHPKAYTENQENVDYFVAGFQASKIS